jgi:hypothetical protein
MLYTSAFQHFFPRMPLSQTKCLRVSLDIENINDMQFLFYSITHYNVNINCVTLQSATKILKHNN